MAKVYITEHMSPKVAFGNSLPMAPMPPLATQVVSITGTSQQSAVFDENTKFIGVHADAACSVEFGADPSATTNSRRLAANATEYFTVTAGHKLAVITNS